MATSTGSRSSCDGTRLAGAAAAAAACAGIAIWATRRWHKAVLRKGCLVTKAELLSPELRSDHLAWNSRLHQLAKGDAKGSDGAVADGCCAGPVLAVGDVPDTFIVVGHAELMELSKDPRLTSNPYDDDRLIALNTMSRDRHGVVSRVVQRFYQHREMRKLEKDFAESVALFGPPVGGGGLAEGEVSFDVMPWAKRVHMSNTLRVLLGGQDARRLSKEFLDELIDYNSDMVRLVAPLGGVGQPCPPIFSRQTLQFLRGAIAAIPAVLSFLRSAGLLTGLAILRPDKTLLRRSDMGSGVWHYPELLPRVPAYFELLLALLREASERAAAREAPQSPLEALALAVQTGEVSLAESLVTIVQLMVNMTSANALGSLVMRLCKEPRPSLHTDDAALEDFVAEVLRLDAPLQRNPRRALEDIIVGDVMIPRGSSVLLFVGAANMDPNVFEAPSDFRPGRREQPVTFGAGPHYCLGGYLVKAEMKEALRFLLQNFRSFRFEEGERVCSVDVGNYGFEALRVAASANSAAAAA